MISVVIPTLDAGATLAATLDALGSARREGLVGEVVLSDGGSHDATLDLARSFACTVIRGERGRGIQLAKGAETAVGPWLLFLHADTILSADWAMAVRAFIGRPDATSRAAVFTFALDDASPKARVLEALVATRIHVLGLPYGDQGLLVSRRLYEVLGGFRPIPLLEDVDLVRRLGRRRIEVLGSRAVTSAARYRRDGYAVRVLRNAACLALFSVGLPPRTIAKLYER